LKIHTCAISSFYEFVDKNKQKYGFFFPLLSLCVCLFLFSGCLSLDQKDRLNKNNQGPLKLAAEDSLNNLLFKQNYTNSIHLNYQNRSNFLPNESQDDIIPWKERWLDKKGGVALRVSDDRLPNKYSVVPEDKFYSVSAKDTGRLSPAEKFDLLQRDFDYPTFKAELERTGIRSLTKGGKQYQPGYKIPEWLSLEKYVAAASIIYGPLTEVKYAKEINGVKIVFSRDEILGLLGLQMLYSNLEKDVVISTCSNESIRIRDTFFAQSYSGGLLNLNDFYRGMNSINSRSGCGREISPAAFHVALTNELGIKKNKLIFETLDNSFTFEGVAYGYKYTEEKSIQLPGKPLEQTIKMQVELFSWKDKHYTKQYHYKLFIDDFGHVIGGVWIGQGKPQLVWKPKPSRQIVGYYSTLVDIIDEKVNVENN
jgi:hypothetical protein